jgi:ribosomal 30S subunit maturation factor RimM
MITIGRILKTKGYDGTTIIDFYYPIVDSEFKAFFIEKNGQYLPLLIDKINITSEHTSYILWKNYASKELAVSLNNMDLCMEESLAQKHFDLESLEDFTGYDVFNYDKKIGTVNQLYENNFQETVEVLLSNGKSLLIPLIEPLLATIDDDAKTIHFELDDEFIKTFSS